MRHFLHIQVLMEMAVLLGRIFRQASCMILSKFRRNNILIASIIFSNPYYHSIVWYRNKILQELHWDSTPNKYRFFRNKIDIGIMFFRMKSYVSSSILNDKLFSERTFQLYEALIPSFSDFGVSATTVTLFKNVLLDLCFHIWFQMFLHLKQRLYSLIFSRFNFCQFLSELPISIWIGSEI